MEMSAERVVGLLLERQLARSGWRQIAAQIRDAAEGRLVVPLPEVDETERPAVANLIVQGIDQTGMRIASTPSQTRFFPVKPGQKTSEKDARTRTAAFRGLHAENTLNLVDRRRARWFVAYGSAPVLIRPVDGRIVWEARDPLVTFPAPSADPDAMMADNCVFSIQRPWWWVRDNYPEHAAMLRRPKNYGATELITLVEYIDSETWMLCAQGPEGDNARFIERVHGDSYSATPGIGRSGPNQTTAGAAVAPEWVGTEAAVTLVKADNRSGICPVINPQRICLGQVTGQFDQMVGIYAQQAKLMALEINAVTEAVFPPVWAIQNQGEQLEIVTVADGKRGIVGEIRGGSLQPIQLNPGFQTYPTIQYLDGVQRRNGGVPGDWDGDTRTHISGRRGEQVTGAVIDFPIQEAQESFDRSRWHENMCAIAVGRGYFRSKQFSFGPTHRGRGNETWSFGELFPNEEACAMQVRTAWAGADINGGVVRVGQKMGLGLLSKETARETDPEIDDPELEKDRIDAEALEDAMRSAIQQQAATGAIPPSDIARINQLVRTDRMDLADAVMRVQEEAQKRQAAQVDPASPEAQPGLAQPGMGAEAGVAPGPQADMLGLDGLLARLGDQTKLSGALRIGQRSSPAEQRAEAAAGVAQ